MNVAVLAPFPCYVECKSRKVNESFTMASTMKETKERTTMDSVWNHATKRNDSVPDDVLEAMWIRHLTLDRDNPERALEGHLAMMYDVNLDHDYGTGVVDDTRAKSVVEREKELWQKGQEYFEQGWRLCFGERHVIGIPCEVPVDALSWVVVSAGHIATTEAHRLTYVIKR